VRKGQYRYMAPEQLAAEVVTAATDQFAFAITLAELLTGRLPYRDAQPWKLLEVLREGPNLDGIAEDLRAIIRIALAIDPADRFASVEEMRLAMADAQATRPRCGAAEVGAWVTARASAR
jgi:serine/threonine-protein kinase